MPSRTSKLSFRVKFGRWLAGVVQGKPKGRTTESTRDYFQKRDRSPELLEKYETIYKQGGLVSEAIDSYPLFVLSNGWRLEGEDPGLVKKCQDFCDGINFDERVKHLITDALVFTDGFQEIVKGQGSRGDEIVDLGMLPGKTIDIEHDEHGTVLGYVQRPTDLVKRDPITFKRDEVIHLRLNFIGGSVYGLSLIGRAFDDILRDTKVAEATAASIERHGFPKYHVQVGEVGEDVPDPVMDDAERKFQDLNHKNEMITSKDVDIKMIDGTQLAIKGYSEWTVQRVTTSIGTPEEILGLGRGSTEATANVRLQAFYKKVAAFQKYVEKCYNTQLFDRITQKQGAVRLVFNDVSPVDETMKSDYVAKIMAATPADPFAILSPEYIREYLGVEETRPDETHEEGAGNEVSPTTAEPANQPEDSQGPVNDQESAIQLRDRAGQTVASGQAQAPSHVHQPKKPQRRTPPPA